MANTITQRTIVGSGTDRNVYRLVHIIADGATAVSDLVVFDNSAFSNDPTQGSLRQVWLSGNSATLRLEWDQTTKSPAFAGDPVSGPYWDFRHFAGINNPNGAGATGDLLLSASGMAANDEVFILFHIVQG